jgi:putative membrane protein
MSASKQFALAVIAAMSVVACAGDDTRNQTARDTTPGAAQGTAGTSGSASVDRDFVENQLADGQAEVVLGQLAAQRASSPAVREFGEMMVRDHQKAGEDLKQLATKHNIQLTTTMDDEHNELRERLAKLSGVEFDREYIKAMVEDHQEAVDDTREKAERGDNTDIKQWASKTLPVLEQHLERAKQIQNQLDNQRQ